MDSRTVPVLPVELNTTHIIAGSVSVRRIVVIRVDEPVELVVPPPVVYLIDHYFGEPRALRLLTIPQSKDFRGPPRRVRTRPSVLCPHRTTPHRRALGSPILFPFSQSIASSQAQG